MSLSEGQIKVPITRFLGRSQEHRTLREVAQSAQHPEYHVVSSAEYPGIVTGISSANTRIILNYFELTRKLITDSYVTFPKTDPHLSDEVNIRAGKLGLELREVPGFTGVPKILDALKTEEIDHDIFFLLWGYVAPQIPWPIQEFIGRSSTDYNATFVKGILGKPGDAALVEEDGQTPYSPRFEEAKNILVETFPDPKAKIDSQGYASISKIPEPNAPILKRLGLLRTGVPREAVSEAIFLHGPSIVEEIGLDANKYRLHLIRYEDLLRIGNDQKWGRGPMSTFMEGWKKDQGRLITVSAGHSLYDESEITTGYFDGLSNFYSPNEFWVDRIMHQGTDKHMIRLCISAKAA